MIDYNKIPHIRAEVLLNRLYPEFRQEWKVRCMGSFYRNYTQDVLFMDDNIKEVELSRDGLLNLLPEGVYNRHDELKGEDMRAKYKELEQRIWMLREAFKPIDTYWFKQNLDVERQVSELLEDKVEYVLRTYFDFDLSKVQDPLVKEVAVILPFINSKRGDFDFVRLLLKALLQCEVNMETGRYSHTDTSKRWLPMIRYDLLMPGLTAEEYNKRNAAIEPLRDFICEWLMPMEVVCLIKIKESGSPQLVNERLILDYNTETKYGFLFEN